MIMQRTTVRNGYLLELCSEKQAQTRITNISSHMSSLTEPNSEPVLVTGMVWWTPGRAPRVFNRASPLFFVPQIWPTFAASTLIVWRNKPVIHTGFQKEQYSTHLWKVIRFKHFRGIYLFYENKAFLKNKLINSRVLQYCIKKAIIHNFFFGLFC
jgi:hypothetical protein